MKSKIIITGHDIKDEKFRCFYKLFFDDAIERKKFVAKLQHQLLDWDKLVAWVVDPKNNQAEAYLEIPQKTEEEF